MDKKSDKRILFMQIIGIILVVIGHSGPIDKSKWQFTFDFIYSFHMPLFFFISGTLFYKSVVEKNRFELSYLIKNKAVKLFIPYIIITLIAFIPKIMLSKLAARPIEGLSLQSLMNAVFIPVNNPIVFFWFLPVLFFIFVYFQILLRVYKKYTPNKASLIILIISTALFIITRVYNTDIKFLDIGKTFYYQWYFMLGIIFSVYRERGKSPLFCGYFPFSRGNEIKGVIYFIIMILSLITLILLNIYYRNIILTSLVGIIFIIFASYIPELEEITKYEMIKNIGNYSYQIYLLSWFPQVFYRIIFYDKNIRNIPIGISMTISTLISIILPVVIAKNVQKINNKWLKIILGM